MTLTLVASLASGAAWAYWTAGSVPGGSGASGVATVNQGATPTATVVGRSVTVTWAATTLTTGQAVSGYTVKRYSGSTVQSLQAACTGTIAGTSCIESNVPLGTWTYSVTPMFATNWTGIESAKSSTVDVVVVAPVAVADGYSVGEDATLAVPAVSGVLANDTDADADALTAILVSGVASGALTFNSTGAFTYVPGPNFNGSDSFRYKANDGLHDSNVVAVTLTVTAVNDAPVNAVPGPQQTPKNTNRVFSTVNNNPISISDGDAGGATVQVQLTATNGTVTLPVLTNLTFTVGDGTSDTTMTFTGTIANVNLRLAGATFIPTNNFSGAATLQIVTSDLGNAGSGGTLTDTDTITINVNSLGIFTANQDIGAQPIAGSSAYSAGTYTMSGSGADIWSPPDQFQYLYRTMTGDGRLTARVVTDTAAPTHGAAKAGVMIRNSLTTGSTHAMMALTASNGTEFISRSVDQGGPYASGTGGLNNPYWVRITRIGNTLMGERSSNGTTWIQQGMTQTITMGSTTYVGLVVMSHDNAASYSATFDNVALTTPPTAVADAFTTNEDTTLNVATPGVLSNDTDPESNALTAVLVSGTTGLTLNANGSFAYVPPANFTGAASFTYKTNDGVFDSNTVTVNLTVNPANEVPSFTKGANQSVAQNAGAQTVAGWATAISQGTGESGQLVNFTATNDNNPLFSVQPAVSAAGALTYTPAGATGVATVSVSIRDNGGTANGGIDTSAVQTFTITIAAAGRPIVTAAGANLSFTENGSAVALDSSITVTDSDSNVTGATVSMTTNYVNGQDTLSFSTQNGITGNWVAATGVLTLSGTTTPANYQTALRSITYSNTSDDLVTNNHNVNFVASDAIGAGNTSSRQVAVSAVNDAPVNTVPAGETTYRNTAEVFSSGNGNQISVTDVDAATVQIQLVSTNGTTTLFGTMPGALTFSVGDGTADATMTFTGTKAAVNTALNGLSFNPTTSFTGAASLQIVTSDLGATGSGGTLTDNDTVAISVVLDLGIFTANQDIGVPPGTAGSSSHSAGTYTVAGSGWDIWDVDDHFQFLSMPMTGDGRLTAMVVSQTQTPFTSNPAKAGVMFRQTMAVGSIHGMMGVTKANGSAFTYRKTTNGTSGLSGSWPGIAAPYWVRITRVGNVVTAERSANGTTWVQQGINETITMGSTIYVGLAVSSVDTTKLNTATFSNVTFEQPPVLAASGGTTAHTENVPVVVDSGITATDATSANMTSGTVTVGTGYTVGQDVLAFTNQNGISGSWSTPTMTLTGSATKAQWQTALRSVTYNNTSNTPNTGNRTINFVVNDGSFASNTGAKTVSVAAVNDAPANSVPGAQTANKNTAKVFSTGNGNLVSVTDVDAAGGTMQVQLVSTNGATTLSALTGLTFSLGDGTADATMTFTGSFVAVNAALAGLSFNPTTNFTGAASLQIVTADQGNTGSGGTQTDNDTIAITVNPYGAHYAFDAGTGTTAVDSSGNVNTGTLQAGAGWTTGKVGPYALNLTGATNSFVDVAAPVIDTSGSYTVSGWFKLNTVTGNQTIASIDGTAVSPFYLQIRNGGAIEFNALASDSTATGFVTLSGGTAVAGGWYHVVGVHDNAANTTALYVNGVLTGTTTFTSPWTANGHTVIGRAKWNGASVDFVNGAIDDVRFYDTVLNQTAVTALYGLGTDYSTTVLGTAGLVSYWRLGEATTTSDSFTGTAGVTIQSRAGEIGATWTKHAISGTTDAVLSAGGRARKNGTNTLGATYYSSATPASADYTVEADVYVASSVAFDAIGLIGRVDTANANGTFYLVRYDQGSQLFVMYSRVNGSWDWIGQSGSYPLTVGSTYRVALDMTGSTIRVLVDGVQLATAVSTTITAPGRGGFALGHGNAVTTVTDAAGMHVDNFRITRPLSDSHGTNHGDYVSGPTLGQTGAIAGDANTAALFDGVNDHGTVARQISNDFSIEFWFKSTQSFYNDWGNPHCTNWWQGAGLVDAETGGSGNDFGIGLCDGKVIAGVGGSPDVNVVTSGSYNNGAWHHVVFTRTQSSGALALYVDGAAAGTATGTTNALNAQPTLTFGQQSGGIQRYAGSMDEIAVYNTVMSAATVTAHYAAAQ